MLDGEVDDLQLRILDAGEEFEMRCCFATSSAPSACTGVKSFHESAR